MTGVALAGLDEADRYRRFDDLQKRLGGAWDGMRLNHEGESVVVVPSVTIDRVGERSGSMTQAYEERFLVLLLLLRQPRLRVIYVTSLPVAPAVVEYYLALLPGIIPSHARARLSLVSVNDASPRPLSEKLLERPRLLRRIGFEGRFDYAAIGSVTNLAARLCAEAKPWQILVTQRMNAEAEDIAVSEPVGELALRGFSRPVPAFNVRGLDTARITS